MTLGTAMDLAAVASLSAALVFLALTWWQYGEERVTKAFHEGQAKQTRKGKASAASVPPSSRRWGPGWSGSSVAAAASRSRLSGGATSAHPQDEQKGKERFVDEETASRPKSDRGLRVPVHSPTEQREGILMKKFAVGVLLLAALGAACAKAGSDGPVPDANENAMKAASAAAAESYVGSLEQLAVGSIRASSKAAADAYVESLQQSTIDYESGQTKAAMVEAGITNISGVTPEGKLPSGSPPPSN